MVTDSPHQHRQLGVVGLGRMGANIVRRLHRAGIDCIVYDRDPSLAEGLSAEGVARPALTPADLVAGMDTPRAVWIMVPAEVTEAAIDDVAAFMSAGDTIIDGGNTHYVLDARRAASLRGRGLRYVDVGTSGGVWGLQRGFCLMIGGPDDAVAALDPIFAALAPGVDAAPRTPGRQGEPSTAEIGYLHCGPTGSGHFVKMVHNGIEYGVMAAFAEGFNLMRRAGLDADEVAPGAETALLGQALAIDDVAEVWRRGSVVASWLLDLAAAALVDDSRLDGFDGIVSDSGEGRWALQAGIDSETPLPVLSQALFSRFGSRDRERFAHQMLSAMRAQFGGHSEVATGDGA